MLAHRTMRLAHTAAPADGLYERPRSASGERRRGGGRAGRRNCRGRDGGAGAALAIDADRRRIGERPSHRSVHPARGCRPRSSGGTDRAALAGAPAQARSSRAGVPAPRGAVGLEASGEPPAVRARCGSHRGRRDRHQEPQPSPRPGHGAWPRSFGRRSREWRPERIRVASVASVDGARGPVRRDRGRGHRAGPPPRAACA